MQNPMIVESKEKRFIQIKPFDVYFENNNYSDKNGNKLIEWYAMFIKKVNGSNRGFCGSSGESQEGALKDLNELIYGVLKYLGDGNKDNYLDGGDWEIGMLLEYFRIEDK